MSAGILLLLTTIIHGLPCSNHIKFNVMTENMITDDRVLTPLDGCIMTYITVCPLGLLLPIKRMHALRECIQTGITGPPELPKTTVQESFVTLVGGTKVVVLLLLLLLSSSSSSSTCSSSSFFSVSSVVTVVPSAEARYKGEEGVVASKEGDNVVGEVVACAQHF